MYIICILFVIIHDVLVLMEKQEENTKHINLLHLIALEPSRMAFELRKRCSVPLTIQDVTVAPHLLMLNEVSLFFPWENV